MLGLQIAATLIICAVIGTGCCLLWRDDRHTGIDIALGLVAGAMLIALVWML